MTDEKEASKRQRICHKLRDGDGGIGQWRGLNECDALMPMQGRDAAGFRKAGEQTQLILLSGQADGAPYLRQRANGQYDIGLQGDQQVMKSCG